MWKAHHKDDHTSLRVDWQQAKLASQLAEVKARRLHDANGGEHLHKRVLKEMGQGRIALLVNC